MRGFASRRAGAVRLTAAAACPAKSERRACCSFSRALAPALANLVDGKDTNQFSVVQHREFEHGAGKEYLMYLGERYSSGFESRPQ